MKGERVIATANIINGEFLPKHLSNVLFFVNGRLANDVSLAGWKLGKYYNGNVNAPDSFYKDENNFTYSPEFVTQYILIPQLDKL